MADITGVIAGERTPSSSSRASEARPGIPVNADRAHCAPAVFTGPARAAFGRLAGMTPGACDAHPRLRLRRLRQALRCSRRDRASPRCRRARGGPLLRHLALKATRIRLDAVGRRALRRFLDADRARTRSCVRAGSIRRQIAAPCPARRLLQARCFPGRTRRARGAEGERREDRDPFERQSTHAGWRCRCCGDRRSARRGSLGRGDPHLQAAAGRLCDGDGAIQRRARGYRVRLLEPLGRDGRDCVRLPLRVGQPRRTCRTNIRSSRP